MVRSFSPVLRTFCISCPASCPMPFALFLSFSFAASLFCSASFVSCASIFASSCSGFLFNVSACVTLSSAPSRVI